MAPSGISRSPAPVAIPQRQRGVMRQTDLYNAFRCSMLKARDEEEPENGEYDIAHVATRPFLERALPIALSGQAVSPQIPTLLENIVRTRRLILAEGEDTQAILWREQACMLGVLEAGAYWAKLFGDVGHSYEPGLVIETPFGPYQRRERLIREDGTHMMFRCYGEFDEQAEMTLARDPTWTFEVEPETTLMVVPVVLGRRTATSYQNAWVRRFRLRNGQLSHTLSFRDPADPSGFTRRHLKGERQEFQEPSEITQWVKDLWNAHSEQIGLDDPFLETFRTPRAVARTYTRQKTEVFSRLMSVRDHTPHRNPWACYYPGTCPFVKRCWQ